MGSLYEVDVKTKEDVVVQSESLLLRLFAVSLTLSRLMRRVLSCSGSCLGQALPTARRRNLVQEGGSMGTEV